MPRRRDKLTARERAFVDHYFVEPNATKAATEAGYSPRTAKVQGSRLLTRVNVQNALEVKRTKREERTEVTADRVIEELAAVGFAKITDYASWDTKKGIVITDSKALSDAQAAGILEVTPVLLPDGRVFPKIKLHNKLGALRDLGVHTGVLPSAGAGGQGPSAPVTLAFLQQIIGESEGK